MRSEVWIKFCLFWGSVLADSEELEDYEAQVPCIPVGYKCYVTDDCCAGAACVATKWSSHLVCLVAGYKEDIKLDRIGRKKEVQPQDLEYLKNMYGFSVDSWGRIRDFETILDPLYSSTPRPDTEKTLSETVLPQGTNSIETLFEILFNLHSTTSFTSNDFVTTISPIVGSEDSDQNLKLPNSVYPLRRDQSVIFNQEELSDLKTQIENTGLLDDARTKDVQNRKRETDSVNAEHSVGQDENDVRVKRDVVEELYSDDLEGSEEKQYSDSYSDPFGSYIDNTDQATLIDNITTQIKQTDVEFKPLSYSSLETLLQNLTGFELTLPNFTWPFTYNESSTVLSPVEPVTIPERLWNLAKNGSSDYPELDFGETYDMLRGNYSEDWFMGGSVRDDSISFNLTSVNKFLNGFGLGFFKVKNGSSSWQRILKFVHSEKKNFTDTLYMNRSIVVRVKNKPSNKSTWRMITGFFRNNGDETIKFNLIPRNVSSNNSLVDLIGDFDDCGLSANVSCLLWSILNSNGTKFTRKSEGEEGVRSRLWREVVEEVRKNRKKKSHFVDVVRLVNRKQRAKGHEVDVQEKIESTTGMQNTTEENEKWWSKIKQVFRKVDKNISKSDNFDLQSSIFNTSEEPRFLNNSFENFSKKINLTENSGLWKKIKRVFKTSSKSEATTLGTEATTPGTEATTPGTEATEATTPGTDVSDFIKRYMAWSIGHRTTNSYDSATQIGSSPLLGNMLNEISADTTTVSPTYLGPYFDEIRSKSTYGNIFK